MPSNVRYYAILSYLSLLVSVVNTFSSLEDMAAPVAPFGGVRFVIAVLAVTFALSALLIWLASSRRQNWSRWLQLILFVPILPLGIWSIVQAKPYEAALGATTYILEAAALYLVFTGNARPWFRKKAPA